MGVVLLAGSGPLAAQPGARALGDRLDAWLAPWIAAGHLSGTVLLAVGDTASVMRTAGRRHAGGAAQLAPDLPIPVASLSKPMLVIVAERLAAEGRLRLDEPVVRWVPALPGADRITLDMLLRHRAGIPHRIVPDSLQRRRWDSAGLLAAAAAAPRDFAPGEGVRYSSGGYTVAALVLEQAGGLPWAELLRRHVAAPVGATHLGDASEGPPPGSTWGQYLLPGGPVAAPPRDLSFLLGGGSVHATAADVARIARGVVRGTYGAAVRRRLLDANGNLAWEGATSGHRAVVRHRADGDVLVVYLANLHTGVANLLARDLPRLARGESIASPPVPRPAVVPATAALRRDLPGRYRLGWVQSLAIESDTVVRLGDWPLWVTGPDRLFWPQDYAEARVMRDAAGRVERLVWTAGGTPTTAARVPD